MFLNIVSLIRNQNRHAGLDPASGSHCVCWNRLLPVGAKRRSRRPLAGNDHKSEFLSLLTTNIVPNRHRLQDGNNIMNLFGLFRLTGERGVGGRMKYAIFRVFAKYRGIWADNPLAFENLCDIIFLRYVFPLKKWGVRLSDNSIPLPPDQVRGRLRLPHPRLTAGSSTRVEEFSWYFGGYRTASNPLCKGGFRVFSG